MKTDENLVLSRKRHKDLTPAEFRHALVGPPKSWKMKRDFQIQFLRQADLSENDYLLDIGCGTLRGGIPIIAFLEAGHYYGFEVREDVLAEGIKELTENALEAKCPTLVSQDDILLAEIEKRFEFIWAFSVFIHMTDEILESTFRFIAEHLTSSGACYGNVNMRDSEDRTWQGFPVTFRPPDFYNDLAAKHGLDLQDIGSLRELGHDSGDPSQDSQRMLKITLRDR